MFLSNTCDNFVLIEQDPEDVFIQDNDGNLWELKHNAKCCWIIKVIHVYEYDHYLANSKGHATLNCNLVKQKQI